MQKYFSKERPQSCRGFIVEVLYFKMRPSRLLRDLFLQTYNNSKYITIFHRYLFESMHSLDSLTFVIRDLSQQNYQPR